MKRLVTNKGQLFALNLLIAEELDKRKKVIVEVKASPKSLGQLGYLHSTVLKVMAQCLSEYGEIASNNQAQAKYWLKRKVGYGEYYKFGEDVVFDPKSFADADIDTLIGIIDCAIHEAENRGYYIPPPKEKDEANQDR